MANIEKLLDEIDKLTVVELSELVKAIEEKYDVSATAVAAPVAGGAVAGPAAEAKSEFDVELKEIGANKISVIKVVREITALGLGEAKTLVESAPAVVKEGVAKEEAEAMLAKLTEAGAVAELK